MEKELQGLIDKHKLSNQLSVEKIKGWVFNERGKSMEAVNKFMKKFIDSFQDTNDKDFNKILEIANDCWNYFPHKILGGKSPDQMMHQEIKKHSELKNKEEQKMPKMIAGGKEMEWKEYEEMIKEMERQQQPFKEWIDKELLPRYKEFLEKTLSEKTAEMHYGVADIFLERVLHVGFIEFGQIRNDFIQREFPRWWQIHVLMNSLKEKEVLSSLKKLFQFIDFTFDKNYK